jgi:hypothetical protein
MKFRRAIRSDLESRLAFLEQSAAYAHVGGWRADVGPDAVLELTAETYRILGLTAGAPVRNVDFFNAVHPDDRDLLLGLVMQVRAELAPSEVDLRIVRPDGTRRVHLTAAPAPRKDERAVAGTIQDVTDTVGSDDPATVRRLRLAQDLRRALEEGGQLFVEYQPMISLVQETYVGAEALVR